ncbi:MAG: YrdB family protein [Acidimicrobiia bacterium]
MALSGSRPCAAAIRTAVFDSSTLAASAFWGWQMGSRPIARVLLAAVAPLIVATIWGRFISPQAPHRLQDPVRVAVEIVIFGGAAAALAATGTAATERRSVLRQPSASF